MTQPISTEGLIDFVQNFTMRRIHRFLNARTEDLFDKQGVKVDPSRSKASPKPKIVSRGRQVSLRDVDSHSFSEEVLNSTKVILSSLFFSLIILSNPIFPIFSPFSCSSIRHSVPCVRCLPRLCSWPPTCSTVCRTTWTLSESMVIEMICPGTTRSISIQL